MNHMDNEKLAQECWDAVADTPFAATQVDHQLRLCTIVNSIDEQLQLSKPPLTNSAGLEDFEAEVVRRLTSIAVIEPEVIGKKVTKKK